MPVLLSHYFADNIVTNSIKTKNGPHQKQTSKQKTFKKKQTKYPKSGGLKDKSPSSQSYGFSSSHVWMWKLDYKESWALKNWCSWTVVLEKTLESPLDCKEIHAIGNQSSVFTERTDAEAEAPILWPPDAKNWLIGKDPEAGKDWRQEEKGTREDEMAGWHHWLDGLGLEQALGVSDGQGSLVCCSPWGRRESDTTERLSWTALSQFESGGPQHKHTGSHQWTWRHYFPAIYEVSALKRETCGGITPDLLVTLWFQGISGWKHKDGNSDDKHHKQKNTEHKLQSSELFQLLSCHLQRKRKQV